MKCIICRANCIKIENFIKSNGGYKYVQKKNVRYFNKPDYGDIIVRDDIEFWTDRINRLCGTDKLTWRYSN